MNSKTLAAQAGVTYRQLDYWTDLGLLRPEGEGSGHDRYWPLAERQVARGMGELVKYGLKPQLAHDLARSRLVREALRLFQQAAEGARQNA